MQMIKQTQSLYESNSVKRTPKTSHDLKRHQITSTDANENDKFVSRKVKTKTNLRGVDPKDFTSHGSIHTEQAFSSPING